MTMLLAIVVTAIIAGTFAAIAARRVTRSAITEAIGGPAGVDPIDAHRAKLAQAEAAQAESAARVDLLQLSIDALNSGVIITDASGKELVRNRLATDATARPHERSLVDGTIGELLVVAGTGKSAEREVQISGPPPRTLYVQAVPITADARVVGVLALVDDVTDIHRIEKTRRDFVANLSHELRTPVGALSLLAEMVAEEDDPATRAQLSERLIIETERMAHTINDLLELSRIESEQEGFDEPVNVQRLVLEAVERTKVAAADRQIVVGALAPVESIDVRGNNGQLLSAVVNLVENAIKYSDAGDSVSVRARVEGPVLQIIVQDTGRGIPARDRDRIFERFYRVDRSRDSRTGGTGIGLSIVRHVAINHGGSVRVDSFEGEGSTFTIELPIVASRCPRTADAAAEPG